jgi:WD40 repeat protein/tRNA A-37 threonylcarbamoyl transferase component Bud32
MSESSASQSMSEQSRQALNQALADQARHWQSGTATSVEDFLEREPALRSNPEAILDLIYKEVLLRCDRGERPQLQEYARRFPEHAAAIGAIFEVHEALESGESITAPDAAAEQTLRLSSHEILAPPSDMPGYELLERLGRGGMGVVYKARQRSLGRIVALKMILAGPHARAEDLARFRREAEVIAKLAHPNIVQIHEVGEHEGRPFLSLEFVDGGGLDKKLGGAPLPAHDAARLIETVARAVHHAHCQGVVHRDLKPANILLTADGIPKITDFGLARLGAGSEQTQSGDVLGTPSYMAPEQASGRNSAIGPATDIYALGATLYELLTGRPPFRADNPLDTLLQVMDQEPVTVRRLQPNVPSDLETICLKCLEKAPSKRYASAADLADDLRRFDEGQPIFARPTPSWERGLKWARRRPALAGLYALAMVAGVVLALYTVWLRDALSETEKQRIAAHKAQSRAEEAAEERRLQLVRARLADGSRLLDEGDWFGSLLPFAEALQLDQHDAKRVEMHRIRLSAILRQCPRLVQFWPHEGDVAHTEFTADGRRILTVSGNTAHLLDADTGAEAAPPMIHGQSITSAALSTDGLRLATIADDQTVQIWDAAKGQRLGTPLPFKEMIVRIAFAAGGERLVTVTRNVTYEVRIQAWEVSTGKPVSSPLATATAPLSDVALSPDGRLAATAGSTQTKAGLRAALTVWEVASGKPAFTPRDVPGSITQIRFSPTGSRVAAFSVDGTVRVWDCVTGKETAQMRQVGPLLHLAFSPDGNRLATGGVNGTARVWDATTGKQLVTLQHGPAFTQAATLVAFSPDGLHAITAGADNMVRIWDVTTGAPTSPPLRHGDKVSRASFGADGRRVLTASADRAVRIWDLTSSRLATPPLEHDAAVVHASLDTGGRRAVTAGADRLARVWNLDTGRSLGTLAHTHPLVHATFTPDGRVLTTGENNRDGAGEASVWDAKGARLFHRTTAQRILGVPDTDPTVRRAWFSADGRWLLTVDRAGAAQVWDVANGKAVTEVLEHDSPVTGVSFSADGRRVLTETFLPDFTVRALLASGEPPAALGRLIQIIRPAKTVNVLEIAGGKRVASIGPWSDAISLTFRHASFSEDSRFLLLVSDGEARLWDIAKSQIVRRFRKPGAGIAGAAMSPDGRTLATISDDEMAQLWNAANGEAILTPVQFRHGGQSWPPVFSPDGRFLVMSSRPDGVRIWDSATGDPVSPPLSHPGPVESVAFSSDGRLLLTASDRAARVWSLSTDERTADEWLRLAQLLSCSRMHAQGGRPVPLSPDELRSAWNAARGKSVDAFAIAPKDLITWHAEAARGCEKNGRWQAALPHLERLAELDSERLDLFARRGFAHAQVGQWKRAAADFEKAASAAPDKHQLWYRHALVRLHLEERDNYRRVCTGMLHRFESSNDIAAAQLAAWTGALAPGPETEAARLVTVAERAVKDSPRNHARLLTLGAALVRARRYDEAVRILDEAVADWGKDDTAWDWLFLAMAHHHLGANDLARANAEKAARWIDKAGTLYWSDRLELTLLRRETEGYLKQALPKEGMK